VALSLLLGWFVLDVRWDWGTAQPLPLLVALGLGLAATLAGAMLVAGMCLVLTRAAVVVLEGVTLALYLLCGVVFPVELLPVPLRVLSFALPWTWWYEALRRFLLGHGASTTLARLTDAQLLAGLAAVTVLFSLLAARGFRAFEDRARALGRLDQTTLF
jgi:ABC-2 type transport system permease protein